MHQTIACRARLEFTTLLSVTGPSYAISNTIKLIPGVALCRQRRVTVANGLLQLRRAHTYNTLMPQVERPTIGMPTKRKLADNAVPSPPRPDAPRRSSRRIKEVGEAKSSSESPAPGIIIRPDGDPNTLRTGSRARESVDRVIRNLGEMEQRFQNAAKKQKLAIESSDLTCKESVEQNSFVDVKPVIPPQLLKNSKQAIEEAPQNQATPAEQASPDSLEAELAAGDVADDSVDDKTGFDRGARRPPPINSMVLPLPWEGRLGYACLNTYLRTSNPPVFSSRTCRMASIIEHRHPLLDPTLPEHPTKNRPDKTKPADVSRGFKYVQELGILNAQDIVKMIRWNDKYGIKFMRLSSEMFPFASHEEHGYKLAPFASGVLAEAGKVAAELGHRLTTHPGQFTQIASPRKEVVRAAMRDLEYHDELLSLLKLPPQQDRDAVMIIHMGGTFGDKEATLDRFCENYKTLSVGVKKRLVLENDDVSWSMHDLLPICEELNIPFVLDFHHHNILTDPSVREGTMDVVDFFDRIKKTWTRKNIRQKMHYSEQTAAAITPKDRRKHSPRVKTLPPCPPDMDLMIEAKDKEQAVFDLMKHFRLPGCDLFNNIIPHERDDESRKAVKRKKAARKAPAKKAKIKRETNKVSIKEEEAEEEEIALEDDIEVPERVVSAENTGMGGPDNRVYWPEGMEEWLRPRKREVKKDKKTSGQQEGQ